MMGIEYTWTALSIYGLSHGQYGSPPACRTGKVPFLPFPFPFAAMSKPELLAWPPLLRRHGDLR